MQVFRSLIRQRRALAALIVAAALALRVLVPGGFMPNVENGRIVISICSGSVDGSGRMTMAMPGLGHEQQPANVAHGKCAYADLAQSLTGNTDPLLLAAALAFILALVLALALTLPARPAARLRPPLRGPPLPA